MGNEELDMRCTQFSLHETSMAHRNVLTSVHIINFLNRLPDELPINCTNLNGIQ